jgi:voltage-gated potassium channel Kch
MNHQNISLFIDDELTLDEKIEFVEEVHSSIPFKVEAVELLRQEKLLRSDPVERIPEKVLKVSRLRVLRFLRPVGLAATVAAAAVLIFFFFPFAPQKTAETPYRFVFYRPDVSRVEITGSFTGWNAVPMRRVGDSGYWEHTFNLPQGEYRFAYLLNGGERLPDPTILTREGDDFGSENTVLSIGGRAT